jgi:lauroyl/myristoyl acyltransferase
MLFLIKLIGRLIARLPERSLPFICTCLGSILYHSIPERRINTLRNLHHSFPEKSESWRVGILKEHCRRLVEMGLFVLASPYLSDKRAREIIATPDAATIQQCRKALAEGPVVLLLPHTTLSEAIITIPLHIPEAKGHISVIFRPLKNVKLDQWVRQSRSRFGIELLSRRSGYSQALKKLEAKDGVGLLFDQNASGKGSLVYFMGRIASSTELPGIMAHRKHAKAYAVCAKRTGFWRAQLEFTSIDIGEAPIDLSLAANEWLENHLRRSDDCCADWLWLHNRWGSPKNPKRRFCLKDKRNRLKEDLRFRNGIRPEPVIKVWFFLPQAEAQFQDLPEILEEIHQARPDYALCLISEHSETQLKQHFGSSAQQIITLDDNPKMRIQVIDSIAAEYPDVWVNLRKDEVSLKESQRSRAEQRYGMSSIAGAEKYLTDLAPEPNEQSWRPFFKRFGLGRKFPPRKIKPVKESEPSSL